MLIKCKKKQPVYLEGEQQFMPDIKKLTKEVLNIFGYDIVKTDENKNKIVTPDYFIKPPEYNKKNICICMPHKYCISETFIHNHIRYLPANTFPLYGAWFPRRTAKDGLIFGESGLGRFLKKNKINAVLAEYGPTGAAVVNCCCRRNIPVIVHFHGFDASQHATIEEFRLKYREMFSKAAAIISVSVQMSEQLIQLGCQRSKLHCIPYGVDTTRFTEGKINKKYDFISVGRFVDKKAPYLSLLAFRKVLDRFPDKQLVMIGDGELLNISKSITQSLNMQRNVTFTGSLEHSGIITYMMMSRVFIQHSVTAADGDSEGTPNAVLEAGACGLPVVSTLHAGIRDAVIDGNTGFLVEERDITTMAVRMVELLENDEMRKKIGLNGRERILTHYNLKQQLDKLWEVIEKTI